MSIPVMEGLVLSRKSDYGAPVPMILHPEVADEVGSRASVLAVHGDGPWPLEIIKEAA